MTETTTLNIWLDDIRPAPEGWTWCKTVSELMPYLHAFRENRLDISRLNLDNDLGPEQMEGYTVLDTLEQWQAEAPALRLPDITVHSANPVAVARMRKVMERLSERRTQTIKPSLSC